MKRLLHIIATPREEESRTLQISESFLRAFQEKHPDWIIDSLNLFQETLPSLSQKSVSGKYVLLQGKELFGTLRESWLEIVQHIDRFKTADLFLVSSPMWNFHIPYPLKQYIDLIVQPGYLFCYAKGGHVEGLVKGKKMVVISSRGGQYGGPSEHLDFQEPYLKAIFGFIGITDISFIHAESMDKAIEIQKKNIEEAKTKVTRLAKEL